MWQHNNSKKKKNFSFKLTASLGGVSGETFWGIFIGCLETFPWFLPSDLKYRITFELNLAKSEPN